MLATIFSFTYFASIILEAKSASVSMRTNRKPVTPANHKNIFFFVLMKSILPVLSLIYKNYTLRSLPQFHISVILACPESFLRFRTSRKDSRQAGMTLKTNIQFSDALRSLPQGIHRRISHKRH